MVSCIVLWAFLSLVHHIQAEFQLSNALSGTKLRCCVIHQPPIVFMDPNIYSNNGINGLIVDYLREMQALLDWQCSAIIPYTEGNGTSFNIFVEMMHNCTEDGSIKDDARCQCDIGIGGWYLSAKRYQLVDILPAFIHEGIRVSFHVSSTFLTGEDFFFLTTFDVRSWVCIFSLILLFALAKLVDRRFVPVSIDLDLKEDVRLYERPCWPFHREEWNYDRVGEAMKSTVGKLLLQPGNEHGESTCHSWLLNITLGICGLFIVLSYEARMTAFLVQERVNPEFQSIEDLKTCRIRPGDVCVPRGSAIENFWNEAIATSECHKGNMPSLRGSFEEILEAVANRSCKFGLVPDSTVTSAIHGMYCGHLLKSEENIFIDGLGMVLPKNSPFTEAMSLATLEIRGRASTPSWEEYFRKTSECRADTENGVMFSKLRVFFVMAFAAGGSFLIISLVERIKRRTRKRLSRRRQLVSINLDDKGFAY